MRSCTHRACQALRRCAHLKQKQQQQQQLKKTPVIPSFQQPSSSHSSVLASPSFQCRMHSGIVPFRLVTHATPPDRAAARQHQQRRHFHDYFVTHLPSSSLHPDQRSAAGPRHQLPRAASRPHETTGSSSDPAPAPVVGVNRDTTVVRIPLRSAKHHFGASVSRGQRPYNEDTYQAGVIEIPAFAKRAPVSLTSRRRAPPSSPLAEYRRLQAAEQDKGKDADDGGDGAKGSTGDPQVFYFGVFDGHGGLECSDFLKDRLHVYIEQATKDFGLKSSLKKKQTPSPSDEGGRPGETKTPGRPDPTPVQTDPKHPSSGTDDKSGPPKSSAAVEQGVDQERAKRLEAELLKSWKSRIGGYFRRFQPALFYDAGDQSKSGADISTILTYAFLRADLDFVLAQARKPSKETKDDPVVTDQAINAGGGLAGESEVHIGGPQRFEGGSTGSVAMVSTPTPTPFWHPTTPATMIFAHVGDTRILLCRTSDGLAVPCTSNHHPSSPVEEERLRRFSGQVVTDSFGEERISGLANTRAFGDMRSKRIGVSAEPEVTRVEMAAAEYSFLVLMSDGISGTLSDQEVVDIVKEARTPETGAKDVVSFATEVSTGGDNATCLVVRLGGWERRGEGGVGSLGTKESRDFRREEATDPRSRRT